MIPKRRSNYVDLTGLQYNFFTVISEAEPLFDKNNKVIRWNCRCVCGIEKVVRSSSLKSGNVKSCGCMKKELIRAGIAAYVETLPNGALMRIHDSYKFSAKARGYEFDIDNELFLKIITSNCFYCGVEPKYVRNNKCNAVTKKSFVYNGIDRYDNNQGYTNENIVACCGRCNVAKNDMTKDNFISLISKIYEKHLIKIKDSNGEEKE